MKFYKTLLCLCLSMLLLVGLCACAENEKTEDPAEEINPSQSGATTANKPENNVPSEHPTEAEKEQPENTLKNYDNSAATTAVLGNATYKREMVQKIIFLDTLASAPADAWDVSEKQNGCVLAWVDESDGFDLYIAGEGGVYAPKNSAYLLAYFGKVREIQFNQCFYTEHIEDMSYMFSLDSNLTTIDLSNFDTSNVTTMEGVFNCCDLTSLDLSMWNTERVTNLSSMFKACLSLEEINLNGWNTGNLEWMVGMFEGCRRLTHIDLSSFDTSKVTHMGGLFSGCTRLISVDVSGFDTSNVEYFGSMFYDCESIETIDLSNFDFTAAKSFNWMFRDAEKLTTIGCTITPPEGASTDRMYEGSGLQP